MQTEPYPNDVARQAIGRQSKHAINDHAGERIGTAIDVVAEEEKRRVVSRLALRPDWEDGAFGTAFSVCRAGDRRRRYETI